MTTVERDNEAVVVPEAPIGRPDTGERLGVGGPVPAPATLTASGNEEQKDDGREYVVLRNASMTDGADHWVLVANIEATSAQQAVRKAAETPGTSFLDPDGVVVLVAIPSRSFNPISVTVTTTTSIVLS